MPRLPPTTPTIKRLFALSGNECAYNHNGEKCTNKIIDSDNVIIGEVCHIEAAKKGMCRFNDDSNDEYRRGFENLILLCPIHHKKVDHKKIDGTPKYSASVLREMKALHENQNKFKPFELDREMLDKVRRHIGYDIALEESFIKSYKLPATIIEKLLSELDRLNLSISKKEELFKELEIKYKQYNKYGNNLPVIDMPKSSFNYCTKYVAINRAAREFFKDWSKRLNISPELGTVEINRVGWQHMTRKGRTKARIFQSMLLLSVAEKIINEVKHCRQIGKKFKVRYYSDTDSIKVKQYFYLRAKVRFPHRGQAIIYVVLRKITEKFNDPSKPVKERVWFYSVYEGERGVKKQLTTLKV